MKKAKKKFYPTSVRLPEELSVFLRKDAMKEGVSLTTKLISILRMYMEFKKAKKKTEGLV